jgi:tetratricopeptide (TPR) repeat protein
MSRSLISLLLFMLSYSATSQIPFNVKQKTIDSLYARLETARDTAYVNTLNCLSLNLADRYPDSALIYAHQALESARQTGYIKGEGLAYFNFGNCYFVKMDLKAALEEYFKALRLVEPLGPSRDLENLYYQMGSINCLVPNNYRTVDFFHKVFNTSIAIHDSLWGSAFSCLELAGYYWQCWRVENYAEKSPFLDSAQVYCDRTWLYLPHDTVSNSNLDHYIDYLIITSLILSGRRQPEALDKLKEALHFAFKLYQADPLSKDYPDGLDTVFARWITGTCYLNLGGYYLEYTDSLELGEKNMLKSLQALNHSEFIDTKAVVVVNMGYISNARKNYMRAIRYFKEAVALCDTFITYPDRRNHLPSSSRLRYLSNAITNKVQYLRELARLYEITGDLKNALEFQKMAEEADKKQMMYDYNIQIGLIQGSYENEKITEKIASLSTENELNRMKLHRTRGLLAGMALLALLMVIMVILHFQKKKLKAEQKTLILKQKLLRSQMNPHFLYNALSGIQNFIVTEQPELASKYLLKFSRLVRNILDNSAEEFITLDRELVTIENYLALQKVRYAGIFDYRIDLNDAIDPEMVRIPPMLAQPFIENAIEHGIKYLESGGEINIRLYPEDHILVIEVEDNGIGRKKAFEIESAIEPDHHGMAISITRERLASLNRKLSKNIMLDIIDLKNALGEAVGTRVVFGVPIR